MKKTVDSLTPEQASSVVEERRKRIRLRGAVQKAREKWQAYFEENSMRADVLWEHANDGPRVLYICKVDSPARTKAVQAFAEDVRTLTAKVNEMRSLAKGERNALWLPPLIVNAQEIVVTTYWSSSSVELSEVAAKARLRALQAEVPTAQGTYRIARPPAMDRRLQCMAQSIQRLVRMNVPRWAVCLQRALPPPVIKYKDGPAPPSRTRKTLTRVGANTEQQLRRREYLSPDYIDTVARDGETIIFFDPELTDWMTK